MQPHSSDHDNQYDRAQSTVADVVSKYNALKKICLIFVLYTLYTGANKGLSNRHIRSQRVNRLRQQVSSSLYLLYYVVVKSTFWGVLAILFILPMILERYRSNIIGQYKNSVPASYTISITGAVILATGLVLSPIIQELVINAIRSLWLGLFHICLTGQVIAVAAVVGDGQTKLTSDSVTDPEKNVSRADKHVVYIYARQSQTDDEKSTSIETQITKCKKKAYEDGADDVIVFTDEDESGFSTERDGYQLLMKKMKHDPRPVYVHRINRFGRNPLEGVAEIAKLHRECDLTLKTCKYGHYDLNDMDDLLFLFLNLLFAGKTVMQRIESAWEVIYKKFEKDRNWHTWFKNVPVGYRLKDDGWIEPSEHGKAVIQALANELLHADTRTEVINRLKSSIENTSLDSSAAQTNKSSKRIGNLNKKQIKSAFENSGYEIENFDSQKLKRLLTNSVLIGEVRFPRDRPDEDQKVLEDESLQLLDEELFEEVNVAIEKTAQKYSTDSDKNVDIEYLADHGMILQSMDIVENIKPVCPECNQGMVKNGQDNQYPLEDGRVAHYWICKKCADNDESDQTNPQRKVPYNREWNAIKNELNRNYKDKEDIILLRLIS